LQFHYFAVMILCKKLGGFKLLAFLLVFCLYVGEASSQNIEYDKKLGKENAQTVKEQMGIYNNPAMTAYVRSIGNRLLNHLDNKLFDYEFNLVPSAEPNAFALPGGYIFVTTGLIPILQSEDELACIIAHEIIHSNNRHSVKQMRKGILPGLLAIPGAILGIVNDNLGSIFQAPSHLMVAGYSRKYETEADVEGVALASAAGYDPNALKAALTRMTKAIEVYTGSEEEKSYFSDHPYTPDRVTKIDKEIAEVEIKTTPPIQEQFAKQFNGILFGNDPKYGVIDGQIIMNPTLNLYLNFPKDWSIAIEPGRMAGVSSAQDAAIVFAEEVEFKDAETAANTFIKNIPPNQQQNVMKDVYKKPDGSATGSLIAMKESTKEGLVFAHVLWLPHQNKLLKIVAISTKEQLTTLKGIVDNMRTLNAKEKSSIYSRYMTAVQTTDGESLKQVSSRTDNQLPMNLLEAINDSKEAEVLEKNSWVKVIKKKAYK